MSTAPLRRLLNVNWLNSHNKHCNSMMIGNYSTLLIGDSIIAGLSCYSNIWKRYFKPLYAINCGIGRDRAENFLWRCKNLPSCPNLQNAVIMCGTNNIQHNSVEDIVDGIVEIALSLRRIYHPIAIFVCGILPRDSNWSINRVYIDEINNYLCCKSKLNGINFINHTDWTFQDGSLKPNLFYADKLHLIKEGNAKLAASIFNSINPNASNINEIVSVSSKVFACDTGFNLKQEDFPMLPCNMSVRKTVCNPDKPTVKCVHKSIYKFVCTSSVLQGKLIRDSNVHSCKLVNTSSNRSSKPIHDSTVGMSKPITSSIAHPSKLVSGSNVCYIKPTSDSSICPSKQTCGSNVRPSKSFSAINVHASKTAYGSNVCSRKPISVVSICPTKTISVSNACSSNSDSVINDHSTKSISTSNISLGKLFCRNNV